MPSGQTNQRKVALITGGSRGIGLAMARVFAASGYSVIITGRNIKRLQQAASEITEQPGAVTAIGCDVRDPASVEKVFQEVRKTHSTLDVLINNAGVAHALAPVEQLPVETWKEVIDTNLTGMFQVTRAALPFMRAGGTIVNNLSVAAVTPFAGMSAYNASKFGAMGFTLALREDLRKRGIRVLALLPGATDTDIWGQFWADAPREKMISAETVAQAVLHAVSVPSNAAIEEIRIGPAAGVL
ncbi:MAG TPA: SDR family NAD(P)-dependent oxidoreductase [Candidatus Angelobacter sp.]|jgi:NAD(P)-dependent dehydrogenase (short-subunit alcohol dehydrogenase family)